MKLRNKLIPLTSCLVMGATVAPITMTACSSAGKFVDLKNGYTPTISRLSVDGNKLNKEKAEQMYFNAVASNPEVLVQDYNWTISKALRTVAENPKGFLGDDNTSTLDAAKQEISNVKVGETVIAGTSYHTVSFDLAREQQFTYVTDKKLADGVTAQSTMVGKTVYKVHFKNIPMHIVEINQPTNVNIGPDGGDEPDYTPHLGRGMFSDDLRANIIIRQMTTRWALKPFKKDDGIIAKMVDPWEIGYEYTCNDVETITYNDITTKLTKGASHSGLYTRVEDVPADSEAVKELQNVVIASHYLSDITPEEE